MIPSRPADALIVIDMQAAFLVGDHALPAAHDLTRAVQHLLAKARAARALIVHIQHNGAVGAPDEVGTQGWELRMSVEKNANELVIQKTTDDAFAGTNLAELLAERGARRLAICGLLSEMCVSATARSALARGFAVILAHDAHATTDIPAAPGVGAAVPASVASRAAEWALGDEVELVSRAERIAFAGPTMSAV